MQKIVHYLTRGNKKLDKSVVGWSLPPIKSCLNCASCQKTCYAMKAYRLYPNCKKSWDRNLDIAITGAFKDLIIKQLSTIKKVSTVRIHVSGDFISQDYINNWCEIIKTYPNLQFYTYTKVMHLFDFTALKSLLNMNLINSIADDGKINFGDENRVNELLAMGYKVCPATKTKHNDIKCGKNCTLCHTYNKVCFYIH